MARRALAGSFLIAPRPRNDTRHHAGFSDSERHTRSNMLCPTLKACCSSGQPTGWPVSSSPTGKQHVALKIVSTHCRRRQYQQKSRRSPLSIGLRLLGRPGTGSIRTESTARCS